jgi:predicted flavoprotein YhiN
MNQDFDIIIVGGGAAGFLQRFIVEKKIRNSAIRTELKFYKSPHFGGRCNVTHACFEPNELVKFYPVVKRTTRSFHQFCSHHRMV